MKVNLHIIARDLHQLEVASDLSRSPYEMNIGFAVVVDSDIAPGQLKSDRLYIMRAKDVRDAVVTSTVPLSILCIGEPPDIAFGMKRHDIAWTTHNVSLAKAGNLVNELIALYTSWIDGIHRALSSNQPLRTVGVLSEEILDGPIWMWDCQYQTIFHVMSENRYDLPEQYKLHNDNEPFPIEELNAINDTFRALQSERYPYLLPPMFGYYSLCYNLYSAGRFTGTISLDCVNKEATTREQALLKLLGDAISQNLSWQTHVGKHVSFAMRALTDQLLQGKQVSTSKLCTSLGKRGWSIDDTYICFATQADEGIVYPDGFLIPIGERVCDKIRETIFSISEGSLVFIANTETLSEAEVGGLAQAISERLKWEKMRASVGASTLFSNYENLYFFKKQAEEAIILGMRQDRAARVFKFENYITQAIAMRCTAGSIPETLAPPTLLRLQAYDKENDTDLVTVLRAYLDNNLSANKTAQDLYIHRNTLLGRLKKIEEIGRVNLEDNNARFLLHFALMLEDGKLS